MRKRAVWVSPAQMPCEGTQINKNWTFHTEPFIDTCVAFTPLQEEKGGININEHGGGSSAGAMERTVYRLGLVRGLVLLVWVFCYAKSVLAGAGFESPDGGSYPSTTKWRLQSMSVSRRWRGTRDAMMGPGFAYTRTTPASTTNMPTHHQTVKNATAGKVKCTAQYWSEGKESWPRMLPVMSTVAKVLGSGALEGYGHSELTVLDAMKMEERDGYSSLLKQSSTALVNAYSREGFPYAPWRVKTLFIESLVSQQAAAAQAARFRSANEACP